MKNTALYWDVFGERNLFEGDAITSRDEKYRRRRNFTCFVHHDRVGKKKYRHDITFYEIHTPGSTNQRF